MASGLLTRDAFRTLQSVMSKTADDVDLRQIARESFAAGKSRRVIKKLLDMKAASDRGDFGTKHAKFRRLLKERSREFEIDSPKGSVYGVTHLPTGIRFHVPESVMPAQWLRIMQLLQQRPDPRESNRDTKEPDSYIFGYL